MKFKIIVLTFLCGFLSCSLYYTSYSSSYATEEVVLPEEIVINLDSKYGFINQESKFIGQSYNSNGRVYVSDNLIFEYLKFERNYNPDIKCMTLVSPIERDTLQFISGKEEVIVNGDPVSVDKLDMIRDMRMHFPIRFIGEFLGYTVTWDGTQNTVTFLWDKLGGEE
jgi:hypothetical protein